MVLSKERDSKYELIPLDWLIDYLHAEVIHYENAIVACMQAMGKCAAIPILWTYCCGISMLSYGDTSKQLRQSTIQEGTECGVHHNCKSNSCRYIDTNS